MGRTKSVRFEITRVFGSTRPGMIQVAQIAICGSQDASNIVAVGKTKRESSRTRLAAPLPLFLKSPDSENPLVPANTLGLPCFGKQVIHTAASSAQ